MHASTRKDAKAHTSSSQLIEKLTPHIRAGDLVLVKGSAGSHMGIVVDALRALGATPSVEGDA